MPVFVPWRREPLAGCKSMEWGFGPYSRISLGPALPNGSSPGTVRGGGRGAEQGAFSPALSRDEYLPGMGRLCFLAKGGHEIQSPRSLHHE